MIKTIFSTIVFELDRGATHFSRIFMCVCVCVCDINFIFQANFDVTACVYVCKTGIILARIRVFTLLCLHAWPPCIASMHWPCTRTTERCVLSHRLLVYTITAQGVQPCNHHRAHTFRTKNRKHGTAYEYIQRVEAHQTQRQKRNWNCRVPPAWCIDDGSITPWGRNVLVVWWYAYMCVHLWKKSATSWHTEALLVSSVPAHQRNHLRAMLVAWFFVIGTWCVKFDEYHHTWKQCTCILLVRRHCSRKDCRTATKC